MSSSRSAIACGGNPFFVLELLRAALADEIEPTREHSNHIQRLGRREVARVMLVRLTRLGEPARRLASAVAVLGAGADLCRCAALSGLSRDDALNS